MTSQLESLDDAIDRVAVALVTPPSEGRHFAVEPGRRPPAYARWATATAAAALLGGIVLLRLLTGVTEPARSVFVGGPALLHSRPLPAWVPTAKTARPEAVGPIAGTSRPGIGRGERVPQPVSAFGLPALAGPDALRVDVLTVPAGLALAELGPAPLTLDQLEVPDLAADRKE